MVLFDIKGISRVHNIMLFLSSLHLCCSIGLSVIRLFPVIPAEQELVLAGGETMINVLTGT